MLIWLKIQVFSISQPITFGGIHNLEPWAYPQHPFGFRVDLFFGLANIEEVESTYIYNKFIYNIYIYIYMYIYIYSPKYKHIHVSKSYISTPFSPPPFFKCQTS